MKKILSILALILTCATDMNAMSYEQARREALFLTDKMAYELNLTDEQYDAAYEINLDYLMGVTSVDDVYGTYWTRRNLDMSYILLDAQWRAFTAASYFYRPLYWSGGYWHFGIYARYPVRTYFYFSHPSVYLHYRGGHCWTHYGSGSYYHGRLNHYHRGDGHIGMRDRWNDNGGRHHETGSRPQDNRRPSGNAGNSGNRPNSSSRPSNNGSSSRPGSSVSTSSGTMGRTQDRHLDRNTTGSSSFNRYRTNSSTRVTVNRNSSNTVSSANRPGATSNSRPSSSLRSSNIQSNMRSVSSSPVRSSGSSISRPSTSSSISRPSMGSSSISRPSMSSGSISRPAGGASSSHSNGSSHFRGAR
ncbi:MAG: hypothetical protein ACI4BA_09495 [Prevotella sp.]